MIFRNIRNKRENTNHIRKYGKIASTGGRTSSSLTEAFMLKKWQWLGGMSEKLHKDCKHKVIVIVDVWLDRHPELLRCVGCWGVGAERLCSLRVCMQTSAPNQQAETERKREGARERGREGSTQLLVPNTCPAHEKWCLVLLTENTFASVLCVIEGRLAEGARCGLQNARK